MEMNDHQSIDNRNNYTVPLKQRCSMSTEYCHPIFPSNEQFQRTKFGEIFTKETVIRYNKPSCGQQTETYCDIAYYTPLRSKNFATAKVITGDHNLREIEKHLSKKTELNDTSSSPKVIINDRESWENMPYTVPVVTTRNTMLESVSPNNCDRRLLMDVVNQKSNHASVATSTTDLRSDIDADLCNYCRPYQNINLSNVSKMSRTNIPLNRSGANFDRQQYHSTEHTGFNSSSSLSCPTKESCDIAPFNNNVEHQQNNSIALNENVHTDLCKKLEITNNQIPKNYDPLGTTKIQNTGIEKPQLSDSTMAYSQYTRQEMSTPSQKGENKFNSEDTNLWKNNFIYNGLPNEQLSPGSETELTDIQTGSRRSFKSTTTDLDFQRMPSNNSITTYHTSTTDETLHSKKEKSCDSLSRSSEQNSTIQSLPIYQVASTKVNNRCGRKDRIATIPTPVYQAPHTSTYCRSSPRTNRIATKETFEKTETTTVKYPTTIV